MGTRGWVSGDVAFPGFRLCLSSRSGRDSGCLHITFLGTKLNMSVDPVLKEESLETRFRKMMIVCLCLALYNLQSSSTYFISFDLHNHAGRRCDYQETERLSGLPKVTLLIRCRANWRLNPAFDSHSGALCTLPSRLPCLLTLTF